MNSRRSSLPRGDAPGLDTPCRVEAAARIARLLIADCCCHTEGFLRVDVDATSGLAQWLESLGLHRTGGVSVMVRGHVPERGPAHGGWALVTQAIG